MKIKAVRSSLQEVPLSKPYTIAYNTFSHVDLAFFEIELENGIIGYGTGSPAEDVVGENARQTAQQLSSPFIQQFTGRDIRHFTTLIEETRQHFVHLPGTQAAVDLALHDAFTKYIGVSVVDFLGQKITALPTSVTIGIKSVEETLADAAEYYAAGFRILKVKLGVNAAEDIERVSKLFEKFGKKMIIRVDPNQGYSFDQLEQFLSATAHYPIELIEQPLPLGKEEELLRLPWPVRKKIMGDESLQDPAAALRYACQLPFGVYNIKLMKCGGITAAREIAHIAQPAGVELFWGCNDESLLSITAALHVAYSCPNTRYIDLDGSFDLASDFFTGGFQLKDGLLLIDNTRPGWGVQPLS